MNANDILEVIRIPVLMAVSWAFPEQYWGSFANVVVRLMAKLRSKRHKALRRHQRRLFGGRIDPILLDGMGVAHVVDQYVSRMKAFRDYRPGGWRPDVTVKGTEHIAAARAQGHGVVLWVAPFVYSDLVTKKALHEAGCKVSHLSRPDHGFSSSRFGIRILNPIWTRIEDRYLLERVRLQDGPGLGSALAVLRRRLQEKQIVSITATRHARRTVCVTFLNAELHLPIGPVRLARAANAVLLPVFTIRTDAGKFVVTIDDPLAGPTAGSGDEPPEAVIRRFARTLEGYALNYPSQWTGGVDSTDDIQY
jgi:lauroyl/myristoyl acyltransferase